MKKTFLIGLMFAAATLNFACGSKEGNGNRASNANHDAANQPPVSVMNQNSAAQNSASQNSASQNSANANTASANANSAPVNPDEMTHMDMQSAPNAASAPYDLQFLDTMIAHHQAAVVMSKPALEKAMHPELKNLARNIVSSQTKEISQMQAWREQWFKDQPLAVNMQAAGMADSMKSMDMGRLGAATGNDFDIAFVEMMIPHHQGALSMAKEALEKAGHPEIKTLAQNVIMAQETEIESMQNWKNAWSKQ